MALHTLSVTSAHKDMCIPLRGDMDVALDQVVDNSFSVTFFTTTFESFNITSVLGILNSDGNVVNQITVGGRPALFLTFMFDALAGNWLAVASQVSPQQKRLKRLYAWESPTDRFPTITLSAQVPNTVGDGTYTLNALASDDVGIAKVEFYAEGQLFSTVTSAPFKAIQTFTPADNGTVIHYTAKAYDTANQSTTSTTVTLTINVTVPDTESPVVSISSDNNNVTTTDPITLTATATDNIGVVKVELYKNNALVATLTQAPYAFTRTHTYQDNGAIDYVAKAYDAANNTASSTPVTVNVNLPVPHAQPAAGLDSATTSEYVAAANAAAVGSKRSAGAAAIVDALKPSHRLNIYQDGYVVISIVYNGFCTVVNDGYDIYVQPSTDIISSDVNFAASLAQGTWWYELQGGNGFNRYLSGSVGPEGSNAELTFAEDPAPGQGIAANVKFVLPRSLDQLS